jgi:release factor glutamine methyltransferase
MADGSLSWRDLERQTVDRLSEAGNADPTGEARRLVERASGFDGAELVVRGDEAATRRGVAHLDAMVERRIAGEPLQYVVGSWGFRGLDLFVDGRVLIPRPETEWLVEVALTEIDRCAPHDRPVTVVDLGTGSGAIAAAVATERPGVEVWATDASADALLVASANLTGVGRAAVRVRLGEGSWFGALPDDLRGRIDVAISNPPYIADHEELPAEVVDYEPRRALRAGPRGTEALEAILSDALEWLAPGGSVVLELAPHQAVDVRDFAAARGLVDPDVRVDLAGRERVLVAHAPEVRR